MFGQPQQPGDPQYQPQPMGQPEPAADGTLGTPMIDAGDPMQQLNAGSDIGMPPYEPTDTGAVAADTTSSRDLQLQTPEELIGIKQEALQSLKPLLGHLQQSAEEKFRTTMMMIQAADDQSLIPDAYEAAKSITDDKVRAQALLDVVNEINYFTAQSQKSGE